MATHPSSTSTSSEFEQKMKEIAAKTAHMVQPRKNNDHLPFKEFRLADDAPTEPKTPREDLGRIIWESSQQDEATISATGANIVADAILAAGYRKPLTITTAEELDALRFQAVVLDDYGTPYVCERHRTDGTRNEWRQAGMNSLDDSETILYHGPAIVVYEGTK